MAAVHCRQLIGCRPAVVFVCKNSLVVCTEKNPAGTRTRHSKLPILPSRSSEWAVVTLLISETSASPRPPQPPPPPPHTGAAASSVKDAEAQRAAGSSTWQPQSERMKSQLCAPWDVKTTAVPCVTENARWKKKTKKNKTQQLAKHTSRQVHSATHTHTHTHTQQWGSGKCSLFRRVDIFRQCSFNVLTPCFLYGGQTPQTCTV